MGPSASCSSVLQLVVYVGAPLLALPAERWRPVLTSGLVVLAVPGAHVPLRARALRPPRRCRATRVVLVAAALGAGAASATRCSGGASVAAPARCRRGHVARAGPRRADGGGLQLDTAFGYSPIIAGRFAGYRQPGLRPPRRDRDRARHRALVRWPGHRPGARAGPVRAPTVLRRGRRALRCRVVARRLARASAPTSAACWRLVPAAGRRAALARRPTVIVAGVRSWSSSPASWSWPCSPRST